MNTQTESIDLQKNSKELLGELAKQRHAIDALIEKHGGSTKFDSDGEVAYKKITDDGADTLKKLNELEATIKQREEHQKKLETQMEAIEKDYYRSKSEATPIQKSVYTKEEFKTINKYLKTTNADVRRLAMEELQSVNEKNAFGVVKHHYPHLPDEQIKHVVKTYVVGDDTEGGFFVRPEYANMMIERDFGSASIRPWAKIVPMLSASMKIIINDDVSKEANWVGENTDCGDDGEKEIGEATLVAKQMRSAIFASREILQDAYIDMEKYLFDDIRMRMTQAENHAAINGNGALEIKGILEYAEWGGTNKDVYTRDAIQRIETATTSEIGYEDLVDLQTALPGSYRANARWFMSRHALGAIRKIKDGNGRYIFAESGGPFEGYQGTLLQHPVVILDQMPGIGSADQPIIFGDMSKSLTIGDRLDLRILRNDYYHCAKVAYWAYKRIGMILTAYDGLKILKVK